MSRTRAACRAARASLALALATLAGCTATPIAPATVPIDELFRVEALLGGAPVRMFLDTGADFVVVAAATAERLGIPLRQKATAIVDSTGAQRLVEHSIDCELQLGANTYSGSAPCLPLPAVVGDGIIGMNVVENGAWLFDAPQRVAHVAPGSEAEGLVAAHGYRVTARLPLGTGRLPVVKARVNDRHEVTLLLDTGADRTSLPADVITALALPEAALPEEQIAQKKAEMAEEMRRLGADVDVPEGGNIGVHGVVEQRSAHWLPRLDLGDRTFVDLLVTSNRRAGWIGRDVLARFPWVLHGPRHELWLLEPIPQP